MTDLASDLTSGLAADAGAPSRRARAGRRIPWVKARRALLVPALALLAYAIAVDGGRLDHPLLVPLQRIATAPFLDPDGRALWGAIGLSLLRVLTGGGLGVLAGLGAGVALGLWQKGRDALSPPVHLLRQITLFAWIPLLTAWFGNGETAKITFIALSAFFPAFLHAEQGLRGVPQPYRELARVLRLPLRRRVTRLMLPAALPDILLGLEIATLSAWIGTVGAEYAIGSGGGLGAFLATAREHFRMDLVLAGVAALAGIGYAVNTGATSLIGTLRRGRSR